jgi:hypothetical protein
MESGKQKRLSRTLCKCFKSEVREVCASCSCNSDRRLPTKPDEVKPIIGSTFNYRWCIDLINMIATPHDKMSLLYARCTYDCPIMQTVISVKPS